MGAADRLAAIEARANAATEGPWVRKGEGVLGPREEWDQAKGPGLLAEMMLPYHKPRMVANAEFVAHARTDVPALVAFARAVLYLLDSDKAVSLGDGLRYFREADLRAVIEEHLGGVS